MTDETAKGRSGESADDGDGASADAGGDDDTALITALDFDDPAAIRAFAGRLDPALTRVKIGNEAFTVGGPALVEDLRASGFDVFLDLKYHDIPNTVAAAVRRATGLGVWMLNVHAGGGRRMLEAAREAVDVAAGAGHRPRLIGVTVLTSLERADLAEVGLDVEPAAQVERLASLVRDTGLDGVVCSPREIRLVRALAPAPFMTVTPGVRSGVRPGVEPGGRTGGGAADDQRRTMTPREAILAGADQLVVGRPVTRATDPLLALRTLHDEIAAARREARAAADTHRDETPRDSDG